METFQTARKLFQLSGNFPDYPETFSTVQKVSRLSVNFPDYPETFHSVQKLSRLSGKLLDCLESFQTVKKLSRLSQNFPDCQETFPTLQNLSRVMFFITNFWGQFYRHAQKLSGRAKTFRSTMPTRRRGFSASGQRFLSLIYQPLSVFSDTRGRQGSVSKAPRAFSSSDWPFLAPIAEWIILYFP